MIKQRTLKKIVQMKGIGLHSGKRVDLVFYPTPANTGIIYRRIDVQPPVDFLIQAEFVKETNMRTCLINKDYIKISTIEHLNAALSILGIDNIIIEVNSSEIPIMDGSSIYFIFLFLNAGIKELNSAKKFLYIKETVKVIDGDKWAELKPYNGLCLDFTINFNHPIIRNSNQRYKLDFSIISFIKNISCARTFGFIKDIKYLQSKGLCLGGSFDCAIVLGDYTILNKNGLRFRDEFVRHKILDAIGDLYMCGYNMVGSFSAYKSGHKLNNRLLRNLLKKKKAWKLVTFNKNNNISVIFNFPSNEKINFLKKFLNNLILRKI